MTPVAAVVILDSESGIMPMSVGIANKLQATFPDVQVVRGMSLPEKLRVRWPGARGREKDMPGTDRVDD